MNAADVGTLGPSRFVPQDETEGDDFAAFVRTGPDGARELNLFVDGIRCGGCVARIERTLNAEPDVSARVNFSTRRLRVAWDGPAARGSALAHRVEALGFGVTPYDPARLAASDRDEERFLLRCLGVAGFATANVMLLSVSIWAGYFEGMDEATRTLLHWFSALIVLPAAAYAGRPFFRSAWAALSRRQTNMDVPISLAIGLTLGMSYLETLRGGQHAYFDSAIMLLFFLLIGRFLDRRARGRARSVVERLLHLAAHAVTVVDGDGRQRRVPPAEVTRGQTVLVAAGERIGVDGDIVAGRSSVDVSLITGESMPGVAGPGDRVFAGTLNLSAPLSLRVAAVGEDTLLADIVRLMEVAEQKKARFVGLADRAARLYAPVVHALAALTFLLWWRALGLGWQDAMMIAVAVLIITCPCALGLAVPAVQVLASGRLMRDGVLLKSGTALERFAEVDTVVFDKTGTLTRGQPTLLADDGFEAADLKVAAALARASRHPLARALAAAAHDAPASDMPTAADVEERPGYGLRAQTECGEIRLGSRRWCGLPDQPAAVDQSGPEAPELWLTRPASKPARFRFADALREDAADTVALLRARGYRLLLLSGDRPGPVAEAAARLGIGEWAAQCTPPEKSARLDALAASGQRVLMVGDGLNDAPALGAAHASMSPSTAADISQNAADAVFQGVRLSSVATTLALARAAQALARQNVALAVAYNAVAVPLAMAGYVTPLVAAAAMSASSILVVTNSFRVARQRRGRTPRP